MKYLKNYKQMNEGLYNDETGFGWKKKQQTNEIEVEKQLEFDNALNDFINTSMKGTTREGDIIQRDFYQKYKDMCKKSEKYQKYFKIFNIWRAKKDEDDYAEMEKIISDAKTMKIEDGIEYIKDFEKNTDNQYVKNDIYSFWAGQKLKYTLWAQENGLDVVRNKLLRKKLGISDDDVRKLSSTKNTGNDEQNWLQAQDELINNKREY